MMFFLIVGGALLILGLLAYAVSRWPDPVRSKKKKEKKEPVVPVLLQKDMDQMTERFERRVSSLEKSLQTAEKDLREKDRQAQELKAAIGSLERQVAQEKAWREKEEVSSAKEKKQEQELSAELQQTREALHEQSNERIRLEYEVKELRLLKDSLSADVRKFTGQNNDLERRVQDFIRETRELKAENAKLKYKKEADQWVAKDDYVIIEKKLKAAQVEIDQLRKQLSSEFRGVDQA